MGTPTADKLRIFFPSKHLAADDDTLTELVADAGGTVRTIVDAALDQADDYWNGAVGWFEGDTTTPALRGQFFHVRDFDADTDTLTLSRDLPAAPVAGDTFRLALGGNYRSSHETFGMAAGGEQPELDTVEGTNITGLTIKKASGLLGEGTLTIFFDQSEELLFIKMDAEEYGVGLDVSGDVSDGIVFAENGQAFIQVDVTNGSLPVGDETDAFTMTYPERTLVPDYEGYETKSGEGGKVRHRLEVVKNTDGADTMIDLEAYAGKPAGDATTIAAGESLGTAAGAFDVDDATGWPERSFWVKNNTVNAGDGDCRYCKYRSGNTLNCAAVDWATLDFDAGAEEIAVGDAINGQTSGATAVVEQIVLSSGSWVGDDAAGSMLLKLVDGVFETDENIRVATTVMAVANGASALGLRGFAATSWTAADVLEIMPDVDIGKEEAGYEDAYDNPATESVAPDGVTFSDANDEDSAIALGEIAAAAQIGVWRREWIMDGHQSRSDVVADAHYTWS